MNVEIFLSNLGHTITILHKYYIHHNSFHLRLISCHTADDLHITNITSYELKASQLQRSQLSKAKVNKSLFLSLDATYLIKNMEKGSKIFKEFSFGPAKKSKIFISAHLSTENEVLCQVQEKNERTLSIRIKRKIVIDDPSKHPSKTVKFDPVPCKSVVEREPSLTEGKKIYNSPIPTDFHYFLFFL